MSERLRVRLEKPVHGGHVLARDGSRVILVRHGAPGELVTIEITDRKKVWRADVIDVHESHPGRVPVTWEAAGPGGVGAELAHLDLPSQREWKKAVIHDALQRIGGLQLPINVAPADDGDGWHTRTRIDLTTDEQGRAGMFAHRSHTHIPLTDMPLADPALMNLELFSTTWPAGVRLSAVAPSADDPLVLIEGKAAGEHPGRIRERVGEWEYTLDAGGFWQAHRRAPRILIDAVLAAAGDIRGARVFDLFSGAGLFTLPLAQATGAEGEVFAVEGNRRAARNARHNTAGYEHVLVTAGDVGKVLAGQALPGKADVVVLDPPRVGAKQHVIEAIIARRPGKIIYVSCDPAALARDLAVAAKSGYHAHGIDSLDLFPHTHHVESVVVLSEEIAA